MTNSLKLSAASWLLLSLAHTLSAKDWQDNAKFHTLSRLANTCAKAGWYQGSGFFIMNALINYAWSKNPALLNDPVHKAIAGSMVAFIWVSAWWYAKNGVASNAAATGVVGALQAYSVFA